MQGKNEIKTDETDYPAEYTQKFHFVSLILLWNIGLILFKGFFFFQTSSVLLVN